MKNADLGRSLRRIAADGPEAFYEGEIAERHRRGGAGGRCAAHTLTIFATTNRGGASRWRSTINGYEVYSCPPPLTGGITVLTSLRALEHLNPLGARAVAERPIH